MSSASFVRSSARSLCVATSSIVSYHWLQSKEKTCCDRPAADESSFSTAPSKAKTAGFDSAAEGTFHGLFPARQFWKPAVEYPLWDPNWDGKLPDEPQTLEQRRYLRANGVTRHIILVRHGQYDETFKEDEKRILTPLGREQAAITGQRLAALLQSYENGFEACRIVRMHVSDMARAKETADIIHSYLQDVPFLEPDPLLNEGRPCHHIPTPPVSDKVVTVTDQNHHRIETAFGKYFYRNTTVVPDTTEVSTSTNEDEKEDSVSRAPPHEFEIIVCHANVIRYFLCRALQLPPETWLRFCPFNCSMTYLTIRPTGSVSCRWMGDIGHLPPHLQSFSKHHGLNW